MLSSPATFSVEKLKQKDGRYILQSVDIEQDVIEACQITQDDEEAFVTHRYGELFEEYRPEQDTVKHRRVNDRNYAVQYRQPDNYEPDHDIPPPGAYRIVKDVSNNYLATVDLPDEHFTVKRHADQSAIRKDLTAFYENSQLYEQLNLKKHRGALLYGPPGNGKTHSILRTLRFAIEQYDARAFLLSHSSPRLSKLSTFRSFFEDELTLFVLEEVTEFAGTRGNDLLRFLDGEWSWSNNYVIATTNYPGELPNNLVDRPGRFDVLISLKEPESSYRKRFLNELTGSTVDDRIVERTEGFSIAYLQELVLRAELYDRTLDEILKQFDEQKQRIREAFEELDRDLGFLESDRSGNGTLHPQSHDP